MGNGVGPVMTKSENIANISPYFSKKNRNFVQKSGVGACARGRIFRDLSTIFWVVLFLFLVFFF